MTDITKTIEAMRAAAEAVPEGERVWERNHTHVHTEHIDPICDAHGRVGIARHIAAASPANVLAVLDEVERLRSDMLDALSEAEACYCD